MKRLIFMALASAAAFSVHAQDVLKIGVLASLSGPGAPWGQAILYGTQFAADDINAKGGLMVEGKPYKIAIVAYDDKYQASEAVTAANRLIFEDKVKFIMGPMGGATALAIGPTVEKHGVITTTMAFTPLALGPDKPLTFRPVLTTSETAGVQVAWAVKKYGLKKVGGLFPNDETGQKIVVDLEQAYAKAGVPLAAKEMFDRDRLDMVPLLTRLMAQGVDAIDLDGNAPATAGLIVKQARELGFKGLIIRSGGPATPEIVKVAGTQATEGMVVYAPIDPSNKAVSDYAERYRLAHNKPMNGFSPSYYDSANMLFQAISTAGTVTDTKKIADALAAMRDYKGILGTLNWTGKEAYGIDRQVAMPFYVAEVHAGKEVIVAKCTLDACE
ncbi:ABC transporter substrate-binding protein [Bordetella sp. BOR01]|uniref:ABC transporter substrate-binding protein n=1 Tax=Bordetella sp. BOR01 TaxID=2854779 RepID=UPI001C45BC4D|nr:ABC transporter substrate-binding protein [Bordetella sp. BOR01]MBV7482146.1 ABC transporter substrate-binding protein [Bordetella sp. BOR01]